MIFDGPDMFPNSCVKWTRFRDHELRMMFARHREAEEVLQQDCARLGSAEDVAEVRRWIEQAPTNPKALLLLRTIELQSLQRSLVWMVTNVTGSKEERALRRRGFGSGEHVRNEDSEEDDSPWTTDKLGDLIKRIVGG